jgi:hypothetical protein
LQIDPATVRLLFVAAFFSHSLRLS